MTEIETKLALDPVCGMTVDPNRAAGSYEHKGKTYYFCSTHCLHRFREDPEKFLQPASAPTVQIQKRPTAQIQKHQNTPARCTRRSCVMVQGSCPICGMALEPVTVSLEDEENPELVDMNRRFWVCLFLTIPVFLLGMSDLIPGQPVQHSIGVSTLNWVQLVLATPVVLWGGWPFFVRAWQSVVNRSLERRQKPWRESWTSTKSSPKCCRTKKLTL